MFSKLNPMVMHDIKKYYPMVEAQKSEYFEKIQGHLKKMIERGIKEKIFRIDINSSIAAKINFTLMNNCFETNDFSQEHFSLLENIHQTQEIFLGGLCNEEGFKILNHLRITKFKIPTQ
jgi:hypothetical protein